MKVALAEAQLSGKDIFEYNAESNGAKDVYHCTAQIIALAL
jgi:cellulose biosynthesis protein BcsQ